ncbi:MAG TPA: hypothetical protein VFJ82_07630 [Longimicrobium sp.]|nr:hypothetical protein [Longimicrobium sp.]
MPRPTVILRSIRLPLVVPHFTRWMVLRSLLTWLFVRGAATAGIGAAAAAVGLPPANPLRLNPVAALVVIAIVAVAGTVWARKRNEDTFLLCLGHSRARQLATLLAPVAAAELVMAVVL